jgi:hypothetical protein
VLRDELNIVMDSIYIIWVKISNGDVISTDALLLGVKITSGKSRITYKWQDLK